MGHVMLVRVGRNVVDALRTTPLYSAPVDTGVCHGQVIAAEPLLEVFVGSVVVGAV